MRTSFSTEARLKVQAKINVESGMAGIKRWWVNRYKLPPNHELFTGQSTSDLILEMYEDLLLERKGIQERLESGGVGEEHTALMGRLRELDKAIGDAVVPQDSLIDRWEADIAAGRIPDLEMDLEDL